MHGNVASSQPCRRPANTTHPPGQILFQKDLAIFRKTAFSGTKTVIFPLSGPAHRADNASLTCRRLYPMHPLLAPLYVLEYDPRSLSPASTSIRGKAATVQKFSGIHLHEIGRLSTKFLHGHSIPPNAENKTEQGFYGGEPSGDTRKPKRAILMDLEVTKPPPSERERTPRPPQKPPPRSGGGSP